MFNKLHFTKKIAWDSFCRSDALLDDVEALAVSSAFSQFVVWEQRVEVLWGKVGIWHMENARQKMGCTEGMSSRHSRRQCLPCVFKTVSSRH